MGAWSTALYCDDTTCDVRDDYAKHLKRGLNDSDAMQAILNQFGNLLESREIECLVYFALADTAWKYGRLDKTTRQHALELIEQGGDIFVWERDAPSDVTGRRRTLTALKNRLLSEQPVRKEVKIVKQAPKKVRMNVDVGTVFLLPLGEEEHAALVLIGYAELEKSIEPNFVVIDWHGKGHPSEETLKAANGRLLLFPSGLGKKKQIGMLPQDGRKNPIETLVATSVKVEVPIDFDCYRGMYRTVGAFAKEIKAHFAGQTALELCLNPDSSDAG